MEASAKLFTASWDRTTWVVTIVYVLMNSFGVIAPLLTGLSRFRQSGMEGFILFAIATSILLSLVAVIVLAPRNYSVSPSSIVIHRLGPGIVIPMDKLEGVRVAEEGAVFNGAIRTAASGGAFGFYGRFQNPRIGKFRAYATRRDKLVVMKLKDSRPIVISPDDPNGFEDEVRRLMLRAKS